MSAGKILNTSHALYGNIVRALSGDEKLPKLVALAGGSDTANQTKHQVVSDEISGTTGWNAQQGIARNATHWFAMNTASLKKYDLTGTEVESNTSPYTSLPAGVDHIGSGFIDDTYLYVPVVNWDSPTQSSTDQCIVKYLISDLSYDSHFDISAQTNCNGSAVALSPDGLELYVTSFYNTLGSDQRNTDIYRFNKSTGAFIGVITMNDACVGIQSLTQHDGDWFLGSYYQSGSVNEIYRYDSDWNLITQLDPILSSIEMEGVTSYGGDLIFNHYQGSPRTIKLDNMYISTVTSKSDPQQYLTNSLISDDCTVVMKVWFQSLANFRTVFDNNNLSNDWESWSETDTDLHFRVDSSQRVTYTGLNTQEYYILAFSWSKQGSNVTIKLGVNGTYEDTNTLGTWVTPPAGGLYVGGINASNDQADNIYKDILVFDKVLSDAELSDAHTNFDNFYTVESPPTGGDYATTITLPTITGSHSDFPVLLTAGDFPTLALDGANAFTNGGGNLIAYEDSTKAVRLPVHIFTFVTGASPEVYMRVKTTAQTGQTIYLVADSTQTVQPAASSTYGSEAVYSVAQYASVEGLTDETGTQTPTQSGTTLATNRLGITDSARLYNSTDNDNVAVALATSRTYPCYLTAWAKINTNSETRIICIGNGGVTSHQGVIGTWFSGSQAVRWSDTSSGTEVYAGSSGDRTQDEWRKYTVYHESDSSRKLYVNGVHVDSNTATSTDTETINRLTLGVSPDSTPFGRQPLTISDASLAYASTSDDRESTVYDNEVNTGTWTTNDGWNQEAAGFSPFWARQANVMIGYF
jgi:hypothetical protein